MGIKHELKIAREALRLAMTQEVNNRKDSCGGSYVSIDELCEMWTEEAKKRLFGLPGKSND